jgi:hypothetical protein
MYGNKNSAQFKTPGIVVLFILTLSSCSLIDDVLNVKPPGGEVTG